MQLIYEKNNLTFALAYFVENRFKTFLELTTILRTGKHCTHIK